MRHHRGIHSGIRPHKCPTCGKCFRDSYELKRHNFVHTRESSHQCNLCGKSFYGAYPLKRHMVQHSDDDPLTTLLERRKSGELVYKNQQSSGSNTLGSRINQSESSVQNNMDTIMNQGLCFQF